MNRNRPNRKQVQPVTPSNRESKVIYWSVFLSVLFHAVILVAVLVLPDLTPARKMPYSVVNVRLVSMPAPKPAVEAPKQQASRPTSPKAVRAPEPAVKKKAVVKTAPKAEKTAPAAKPVSKAKKGPKRSLKQKTFKSSKVLESTLSKLKKEVDQGQPPSLEKAFERLKEQVSQAEPSPRTDTAASPPVTAGTSAASTPSEQEIHNRIQIYNAEIAYQIRKNWVFSEQLAGDAKDLETALGITILPDGRIEKIWFDSKSGNRYLDESAYRALMKSSPLPPLPEGLFDSSYTVGLRFGPKGLKQ